MSKVRINILARELEVKSQKILDLLAELGLDSGKTHSSSLEAYEAEKVRAAYREQEARSSGHASAPARAAQGFTPKIDLSHISKPGDVLKALQAKEKEEEVRHAHVPARSPQAPPPPPPVCAESTPPPRCSCCCATLRRVHSSSSGAAEDFPSTTSGSSDCAPGSAGYRFAATCQSGGGCSCCREISRCGHAASCCSSGAASRGRRCQAAGLPCRRAGTATSGRTGTCCGKTAGNACTASGTGRCGTCSASRTDCRRSTRSSSPDTYHGRARSCSRSNGFERRRAGGHSGRLKRGSA